MTRRVDQAVILDGRSAAILWQAGKLDDLRLKARARDDELYSILVDIYKTALTWRATSVRGNPDGSATEPEKTLQWVTPQQVAKLLVISDRTVRNDIADGRLPANKTGRRWLIAQNDVATYVAARKKN